MSNLSDAELTILGLVAESPRYGSEIEQLLEQRGVREWLSMGFSSLYVILNRLEEQKLLNSSLRPDYTGTARKVFEVTEAGRGVLQTAIADLLRQPYKVGDGFELGLANINTLKPSHAYQVLTHHREDLEDRLERVEKLLNATMDDTRRDLYTHSLAIMRAELEWLGEFLADWLRRHPGAEHPTQTTRTAEDTLIHNATPPAEHKRLQRLKRPKVDDAEE